MKGALDCTQGRLWNVPCGFLWVKKKSLMETKETALSCTRTAIQIRSRKLRAVCLFRWKNTGRPERASGAACYWKAKGTKSDRIKCGLRAVSKQ